MFCEICGFEFEITGKEATALEAVFVVRCPSCGSENGIDDCTTHDEFDFYDETVVLVERQGFRKIQVQICYMANHSRLDFTYWTYYGEKFSFGYDMSTEYLKEVRSDSIAFEKIIESTIRVFQSNVIECENCLESTGDCDGCRLKNYFDTVQPTKEYRIEDDVCMK